MVSQNNSQPVAKEKSDATTHARAKSATAGCALILPGAVAKGGYEAGVISVIAEKEIQIDRIVGTSSGALNAVAYAAGIRVGQEKETAKKLLNAWVEFGSWHDSFHFTPVSWFTGKGLSDQKGLLNLLRSLVEPAGDKGVNDFELRIIVASLDGIVDEIDGVPSTTYEKVLEFSAKDFDTQEGLEKIFQATVAACSFPILYSPAKIDGLGKCFDGGTVNNTPIQYALDDGDINRIILPVPFPSLMPTVRCQHGIDLLNHTVEILINERLFRDLKNAADLNEKVKKIYGLVEAGVLTKEQLEAVRAILPFREVKITQVRPKTPIGGGVFSGFLKQDLREKFIEEGRKAALESLE